MKLKIITIVLLAAIALSILPAAYAADNQTLDAAWAKTAAYLLGSAEKPQMDDVGGDWLVLGLTRSDYPLPDGFCSAYYKTVIKHVKEQAGLLHEKKYTEYSRVILALTAAGYDPTNVAGYNLIAPLGDFDKTVWQGINGPIYALLALDSGGYQVPVNKEAKIQATRELYIEEILRRQLWDGGFSLTGAKEDAQSAQEKGDPDVTGMALQAFAKYQSRPAVKTATDKALEYLSRIQESDGGYAGWGNSSLESAVQALVALCELGINVDDPRFVKNGNTLLENILTYQNEDGSFRHIGGETGSDQLATEQAFYALTAARRAATGKPGLYHMEDASRPETVAGADLENKNSSENPAEKEQSVKTADITEPGKTFLDIAGHENRQAIEALAGRGIISGLSEDTFGPDDSITRAQLAAILIRGLGLPAEPTDVFADVAPDNWYAPYVGAAHKYGLVAGTAAGAFLPEDAVTRQEAAVMLTRAAALRGLDTNLDERSVRDILAPFGDYVNAASWARESLAFCYKHDILPNSDLHIQPHLNITRGMVAEMLYRLLWGNQP